MRKLAAILLMMLLGSCSTQPTRAGCREFDSVTWSKADTRKQIRAPMAESLIAQCKLRGMTRKQIVQILGQPTKTNYFREYDLVYVLGPERGFISIDYEWLVIKLGPDGRVVNYLIVTD
jgi:outer membrane protein assembly factor BamE (lipoprotein component of BamABCDE complex)